ncbi:unnamed protein product (macronuclear) [Paramecium tetraurelia]|uniref:Ubiquitin-like domain-containing protein n=2 Tax=Paramecium TaxID=5884 RepID=A0C2N0_PARTE|nr:uncharacterized protein GSPATT00034525001 [Paramecium tetraurelia]CAD8210459.1 unnamed protein product [Paramecium octaurelia]CAK65047.1 unnamed protein product [Paramecium tetraurelia]|eukprot:XP_001432444.1 hypothetical protein (macronuclear) [Paramecium tetraurelia strain d4-2]
MQIFIKTLAGKKVSYNIEADNTIQQLKMQLQEKEGISSEQFKLIFKGRHLQEDNKIADAQMQAGDTVHMVIQLRGGF